jgi:formylglycine-generating enzyme required for sulfatase activity
MFRKFGIALIALSLVVAFNACSKKDGAESGETAGTPEAAQEGAEPEVTSEEMVLIPAGDFILGTDDKNDQDHKIAYYPERTMYLPAFWIDKYEVTNLEFMDFSNESGYLGDGAQEGKSWMIFFSSPDKANYPVIVTWNDAKAYCESKGERLPTEEEWEKAARGTEGWRYPWGNEWEAGQSNTYEVGLKVPAAVGQFKGDVSPFGVHDMLGNVQEWTASKWKLYKGNTLKDDNVGKDLRVVRGLSSRYQGKKATIYERTAYLPGSLYDFGFRCAKDATPEDEAAAKK